MTLQQALPKGQRVKINVAAHDFQGLIGHVIAAHDVTTASDDPEYLITVMSDGCESSIICATSELHVLDFPLQIRMNTKVEIDKPGDVHHGKVGYIHAQSGSYTQSPDDLYMVVFSRDNIAQECYRASELKIVTPM